LAAPQRHDACLGVAKDASNDSVGAEAGEAVRVGESQVFSHPEIMTRFRAQRNKKNHGKMAANPSTFVAFDPHALEKSQFEKGRHTA
jgi:ATP-dependent DNA ligase